MVEDNSGAEVAIEKIITVKNQDPAAALSLGTDVDPEALYEDDPVIFDASGCTDTANDLATLEYMWNFGDNEKSEWQSSPAITHSYAQQDTYTVSLKVRDNDGADDTDSMNVYILNREPVAVINGIEKEYFEGDIITMIGTNSTDTLSDTETLRHYWDLDAGTDMEDDHDPATWWDDDGVPDNDREIAGGVEEFPYINNGTYPISLIVVDNDDAQDIALATIEIKNSLPRELSLIALVDGVEHTETFEVEEGDIIDFRGSATDVEGDIDRLNYTWNFGDGDMAFGTEARHTFLYSQDVPYKVELSVMDDDHDDAAGKALEVYVKNVPPTLELGEDVHLDGNGTLVLTPHVEDSPADVASMRYRWCVLDHGGIPDFTDPETTDGVLEFEFEIDGDYNVHLRIEDDNGESVRDSVKIVARKINPNGDYDNDRMPNGYEIKMGFDPRASDGDLDSDNDGFSNLQEYRANTDPTDNTDYPGRPKRGSRIN